MIDIVELDDLSVVVREYREVEIVVLCKGFVGEWIVDADPYNLRIYLVQFLHVVAQCAHFARAYRGECSGEKREECRAVGFQKLLTTARFSVGIWKCEVRSFFALVDHSQSSEKWLADVSKPYRPATGRLNLKIARGSLSCKK